MRPSYSSPPPPCTNQHVGAHEWFMYDATSTVRTSGYSPMGTSLNSARLWYTSSPVLYLSGVSGQGWG